MSERLQRSFRPFLLPLSVLYGIGVSLRNRFYDSGIFKTHQLDVPVVSVGNLTVGGTGKTPVTLALAQVLQRAPYKARPAVLSRGYGRKGKGFQLVSDGKKVLVETTISGDEPQIFARCLRQIPVAVDEDRIHGGQQLIDDFNIDVLLLDDAFQHRRIHRDLNIILLDAGRNLRSETLLPAGLLREPARSLGRADFVCLTHFDPENSEHARYWDELKALFGEERLAACQIKPSQCRLHRNGKPVPEASLQHKKLVAFCGLAKPQSFMDTLTGMALDPLRLIYYPDHHRYGIKDVEKLATVFNHYQADYLITTEKDAVKLTGLFDALPILVLDIGIEWIRGLDHLQQHLHQIFSGP